MQKTGRYRYISWGILITRAITERPDLYAAAVINVGCNNAMRMENTPNGPGNILNLAMVKDSTECRALYEMDGTAHAIWGGISSCYECGRME